MKGPQLIAGSVLVSLLTGIVVPSRAAMADERRTVKAVLEGAPAVVDGVLSVLRASLDRQGLDLVAVSAPRIDPLDAARVIPDHSASGPVAYLWLDLTAKPPTMILVDARSNLVHVRPLAVHAEPDAVETELIRFVVDSSIDAILKGRALGVNCAEPQRCPTIPPATVTAARPVTSRTEWRIGVGYSGAVLSANSIVQGPELGGELRRPHFHLSITLSQRFPLTVASNELTTRLVSSGARIVAALPVSIGPHVLASVGLGGGMDATHVASQGPGATSAFWATDPLLTAVAAIERGWGSTSVLVRAGVDLDLLATRYVVTHSDGTSAVWTPWRWRPFVGVRLAHAF